MQLAEEKKESKTEQSNLLSFILLLYFGLLLPLALHVLVSAEVAVFGCANCAD